MSLSLNMKLKIVSLENIMYEINHEFYKHNSVTNFISEHYCFNTKSNSTLMFCVVS